jgi:phosphohistidine phosphatase
MRRIAQGMSALKLSFDLILSSPYRRAQETANIVASRFNMRHHLGLTKRLTPGGDRRALIQEISALAGRAGSILLVGHEPSLSTLAMTLVFGRPVGRVNLKKGGLCKLNIEHLRLGRCAELEWLLAPRHLIAAAR